MGAPPPSFSRRVDGCCAARLRKSKVPVPTLQEPTLAPFTGKESSPAFALPGSGRAGGDAAGLSVASPLVMSGQFSRGY